MLHPSESKDVAFEANVDGGRYFLGPESRAGGKEQADHVCKQGIEHRKSPP